MARVAPQMTLLAIGEAPTAPPPTPAEKRATRAAQGHRCARCGNEATRALDVVRHADGKLVGYCRRDRLRWDAVARTRKASSTRGRVNAKRRERGARAADGAQRGFKL